MSSTDPLINMIRRRKAKLESEAYSSRVSNWDRYNQNLGRWMELDDIEKDLNEALMESDAPKKGK